MKKLLLAALMFCHLSNAAVSSTDSNYLVNLEFDAVPLSQFLQSTYRDILHSDYAIDPSLVSSKTISIHAKVPLSDVQNTVDGLLNGAGVGIRHVNNLIYFVPLSMSDTAGQGGELSEITDVYNIRKSADNSISAFPSLPAAVDYLPSGAGQSFDNVEFYRPKFRRPADIQKIVNQFMHTNFESQIDSVMLAGSAADMSKMHTILQQFDRPVAEISVKAAIIEYTENRSDSRGVGLAIDALKSNLSAAVGSISPASNYFKIEKSSVSAVLSAVSGDSRFSLVSAPNLRIRTSQKGHIQIGDSTPTLSSTTTSDSGSVTQSVSYQDSGVILDVTPTVLSDSVDLEISQQLSSFAQNSTSSIDSPTLSKRELSTFVSAKNGELIVLGGLDSNEKTDSNSGFSLLPRWMRTNTESGKNSQILLVLQIEKI